MAYIDVDNFKFVNDNFGHGTGDKALCLIVSSIKNNSRTVDYLSRVGGDEFILLLPETDQASSKIVIEKVRNCLLDEMDRMGWPVTFSIGAITCDSIPFTINHLINSADNLMWEVKRNTKNGIAYGTYQANLPI